MGGCAWEGWLSSGGGGGPAPVAAEGVALRAAVRQVLRCSSSWPSLAKDVCGPKKRRDPPAPDWIPPSRRPGLPVLRAMSLAPVIVEVGAVGAKMALRAPDDAGRHRVRTCHPQPRAAADLLRGSATEGGGNSGCNAGFAWLGRGQSSLAKQLCGPSNRPDTPTAAARGSSSCVRRWHR